MNPTLRRIPVPFRWSIADGLNGQQLIARSYGSEIAGVLSRTSTKWVVDRNGLLVPQVHSAVPLAVVGGETSLLLEAAGTNLCIQSEAFDTWTLASGATVGANSAVAPDGTLTADTVQANADGIGRTIRNLTFTADGEKSLAVFLKAGSGTQTRIVLWDQTATVIRHDVRVNWSGGVPTLATQSGAGTRYPIEALGNGWYRILFSATGVVAANTNQFLLYPDPSAGTGTVYAWGAQAENAVVPSSYIPTTSATVTRAADSLYFPFSLAPGAMTVYLRGRDRGVYSNIGALQRSLHIGSGADVTLDARFSMGREAAGNLFALYDNGATSNSVITSPTIALNDVVEHRGYVTAAAAAKSGASINSATEVLSDNPGATTPGATSFAAARLYLTGGLNGNNGLFAYTHIVVALGEQSMATMRELAGV